MGTIVIGLTGGIGMGKSTAAEILRSLGLPVVDTDDLARELVAPGQSALAAIADLFGPGVLRENGELNRAALAARVFGNSEDRLRLEAVLHPRIHERWLAAIQGWRETRVPLGCVVIPLLFEKGYRDAFAHVAVVGCSRGSRRNRIRVRGWSEAELERREAAQWAPEMKLASADYVVWTEGALDVHRQQWCRILARLTG